MKFSGSDFSLIRWSVLAFCVSLFISAIILYNSGDYAEKAQTERRTAQTLLNDARNRLATAYQDQENMEIYAHEYGSLIESKVIGDDQRLDWMEGLEKIRLQNLVTEFRYTIAPQRIYTPQVPLDTGNFDIHYSEMKLQLDLLHEGQLSNFFAALSNQIKGWYQLEGCTLQRATPDSGASATAATHLKAECSGGWITLKNRNVPQ